MITDHVWRPDPDTSTTTRATYNNYHQRPCGYLNCRQPRDNHQQKVTGIRHRPWNNHTDNDNH